MPGLNNFLRRFGYQVRIFRKQKMLSLEELAGMVGISENDIRDMENGKSDPRLSTILLISSVLGVSPEDLLTLPDRPDRNANQYYALRYQFLKNLNNMSDDELKKLIELSHSIIP
ncbi:MAG: helix-turn-helix transcriptional regulator [Nitrospirae bacterium]|nr:helix-turn-helix transcriptional regulator [Nitrospirota bacterium]